MEYVMRMIIVDVYVGFFEMMLNCEVVVYMLENKKVEYCLCGKFFSKLLSF